MHSPRNRWLSLGLGLAVFALAGIAGCGGDDGDSSGDKPDATSGPADTPDVAASEQEQAVAALAAIDVVDGAGFHDMAKTLAESEEINPRFAGTVENVLTVAEATEWPGALTVERDALVGSLETLLSALQNEDLQAARSASEAIHDTQHDMSKATYAWLKTVPSIDPADTDLAIVSVIAAVDVIDAAGFHDMSKDLAGATEINPRYAGTVERALTAARLAGWSGDVVGPANQMVADLETLLSALEAGDLPAAAAAAEAIHDSQHDASSAAYAWLAVNHPMMSHADPVLATACEIKAVDAVDSVGFHDMAKDLAEASEINPRYEGKIANALAVLAFDTDDAGAAMTHMSDQMTALHDALAAGDLETARELAEAVHDAQHDFSHEMYGQMVAMHGTR